MDVNHDITSEDIVLKGVVQRFQMLAQGVHSFTCSLYVFIVVFPRGVILTNPLAQLDS